MKTQTNANIPDERIYQKLFILLNNEIPDTIVLGSSRIMQLHKDFFPKFYGKIFNNGVSGASLEDYIALYSIYVQTNKIPKFCIIGIDPWIFNKNSGQDRWKSISEFYYSGITNNKKINFLYRNIIEFFIKNTKSYFKNNKIVHTRFSDNSIEYSRIPDEKEALAAMQHAIKTGIYSLENFTGISNVEQFNSFIKLTENHKTKLIFLFTPIPPSIYDTILSKEKYRYVIETEKIVREFAKNHDIPVLWSFNPYTTKTKDSDFIDNLHVRKIYWNKLAEDFSSLEKYSSENIIQ